MIQITGFLFDDAKVDNVNGKRVVRFDICCSSSYYNKAQQKRVFRFEAVRCTIFGESQIDKILLKNQYVQVTGNFTLSAYIDKDKNPRPQMNIVPIDVTLHGMRMPKDADDGQLPSGAGGDASAEPPHMGEGEADDLPF